jgi:predicted nucleic acid-binding protein
VKAWVVDANVAAKWLLPAASESLLGEANRLAAMHARRELQLLAPDLIEAEVGNVLWKAVRRNRITQVDAENSLRHFTSLAVQLISTSDLLGQALQIAVACDRSFYDSLYVALAVSTKTELITADERLVNALGSRFPVRWLGAFHPTNL